MKKNYFRLLKALFVLMALLPAVQTVNALGQKELQELLDSPSAMTTRSSDGFKEIDLADFTEPFTTTLYVRAQNVRFVNGTLKRATSLEGPLIQVLNGYTLELSATATLSGNSLHTGHPIVEVSNGYLIVNGGSIIEPFNPSAGPVYTTTTIAPDDNLNSDHPVILTSDDAHFVMNSGTVQGEIACEASNADVRVLGGKVKFVECYHLTTRSDVRVNPDACNRIYTTKAKKIYLKKAISDSLRVDFNTYLAVGDCVMEGEDYSITQADVDKLSMYYAFWEYLLVQPLYNRRNIPQGYSYRYMPIPFKLVLKNNKVYLEEPITADPNYITNEDDLQRRLDEIAEEKPSQPVTLTIQDEGITISNTIQAKEGCNAIITGGNITVSKNFNFNYQYCVFNNSAILTLQNITIDGNSVLFNNTFFNNMFDATLTIGQGVKYVNMYQGDLGYRQFYQTAGGGELIVWSGDLSLNGTIFSPTHYGKVTVYDGTFTCPTGKDLVYGDSLLNLFGGTFKGGGINMYYGTINIGHWNYSTPKLDLDHIAAGNINLYHRIDLPLLSLGKSGKFTLFKNGIWAYFIGGNKWKITANWSEMELGQAFVLSGNADYPMTLSDFNNMEFLDMPSDREAYFDTTDNSVKLRSTDTPGVITSEDDLQKWLDEIAAQKPADPVEVKICAEGIVLTNGIRVKQNCKAIISGGPISVKQGFGDDALFYTMSDAYLCFNDITLDFLNVRYCPSCFWVNSRGVLEITESVEYKNISTTTIRSNINTDGFYRNVGGRMILRGGDASGIEGRVISNRGVVEMRGDLFKYGANIYNYYYATGTIPEFGLIRLLSSIPGTSHWTINGNWDSYPLETPFIEGTDSYEMQLSDSNPLSFPSLGIVGDDCFGLLEYYDGTPHNIKLKRIHDLQCELDKLGNNSARIDCRGVDVGHDITFAERMQMELDGYCDEQTPEIWMPGGCMFFEPTVPQVTFNDITFDSYSNGHRVYVRTKVDYKSNVRARNFLVFTIVEKGGQLTWWNAWTQNVLYPIYNDGGMVYVYGGNLTGTTYNLTGGTMTISGNTTVSVIDNSGLLILDGNVNVSRIRQSQQGKIRLTSKLTRKWTLDMLGDGTSGYEPNQVVVEGGNGYVLTEADLDLIYCLLPEGYGLKLDVVNNTIILLTPKQMEALPRKYGDVNRDYAVDVADIANIITAMANLPYSARSDVNHDGIVDVADIASVISAMAGGLAPGDESYYDDDIRPEKPFYYNDGEMPCVSVGQITAIIDANEEALPGGVNIIGVTTRELLCLQGPEHTLPQGWHRCRAGEPHV